ncbi:MAG: GNAT family N-acetyltransferase [Alphaproteobacteria bacterium]|nr:GNAT family N-acetyltransferase [Alphaproteobacteria bacterium]
MYNFLMITGNFNISIVSTDKEFAQAMDIRRLVFVDECKIAKQQEFDGNDFGATHILALDGQKPIGTMRIRYFNGFVKMERMCVIKDYRKTDVSEQIMQKAMLFAAQKGYEKAYGVCKKELLNRWKQNGFEPIAGAKEVEQNSMSLIPVMCNLPKVENVITMQTEAQILNAKEGTWFDLTQNEAVMRIKNLTDKVKQIKQPLQIADKNLQSEFMYPLLHKADDKSY